MNERKGTWSVWSLPFGKHYYFTHPWKWFKDVASNIRDAYRRARYGWTYVDCWNWNTWFLDITPPMLRHIAKYGDAYPGTPPFDGENGPERWREWLNETADLLESGREEWQDEHNEYYDEYMKHLIDRPFEERIDENGNIHHKVSQTEISKKYFARADELARQGDTNVRTALQRIAEHFWAIWD